MSQYAVILKDPLAAPAAAAAFLSARKELDCDAALLFTRANPGFLGRGLQLEAARGLAADAARAGLPTALAAEAEFPALPPALYAENIKPETEGLAVRSATAKFYIPYDSIKVIAGAAWDARERADTLEALKPPLFSRLAALAGAPLPPPPSAPLETFLRADIIGGEGPLRLVLRPERLDFSSLGRLRTPSSLLNFRALLAAIDGPAFGAVKNAFVPAFLASQPLAPHKFASPEAADLSLTRLLILSSTPS